MTEPAFRAPTVREGLPPSAECAATFEEVSMTRGGPQNAMKAIQCNASSIGPLLSADRQEGVAASARFATLKRRLPAAQQSLTDSASRIPPSCDNEMVLIHMEKI